MKVVRDLQLWAETSIKQFAQIITGSLLRSPRNYVFTMEMQYTLLKSICLPDAHRETHGNKDEIFGRVLDTLIKNLSATARTLKKNPSVKMLGDKLLALLVDRMTVNTYGERTSGIAKEKEPIE